MKKLLLCFIVFFFATSSIANIYAQTQTTSTKKAAHAVAKKKTAPKKVIKDTTVQKDTEPEPEDTVDVWCGKDIVNLRTFDGWVKDDNGKWISSPNRIPYTNPEYNNELYYKYILGTDNIRQINVIQMKIDNVPYLGILFEQNKAPNRDRPDSLFRSYVGADYYLIKYEDYLKLWKDKMKIGTPYEVSIRVAYAGLVGYSDVRKRPEYMSSEINKDIRNSIYTDTSVKTFLHFGFMPVKTPKGNMMRFNYTLAYAHVGEAIPPFDFKDFNEKYYQVSLDLFHKFARPEALMAAIKQQKAKLAQPKPKATAKPKKTSKKPDDF